MPRWPFLCKSPPKERVTDFREKGAEGRERNTDVRKKHRSGVSYTHIDQGPNPKPRHVP